MTLFMVVVNVVPIKFFPPVLQDFQKFVGNAHGRGTNGGFQTKGARENLIGWKLSILANLAKNGSNPV